MFKHICSSVALLLAFGLTSCTSTGAKEDAGAYYEDSKELPSIDEMGLDNGTNGSDWDGFQTSIPFQSEAQKSTAVRGMIQTTAKGRSSRYVAQNEGRVGVRRKK